ncbi:MAG: tRNA (adenosine(37)-N6)-dimethylallyltransferase MiaA [Blastocatellia bacterium]|nr:tRNA (adenosine(37)-N6)-dimethylallyltransferase MiaA [Blastocatellia bacterium]
MNMNLSTPDQLSPKILAVVGPTASGKSALGLALAEKLDGEVINLDSVQVYKGLYIATAKLTEEEKRGIPHHLIDVAEPTENFTAGKFARFATEKILEIEGRDKRVLLVGGTGFYLKALQGGLYQEDTHTDLDLRKRLKEILARKGAKHLHKLLMRLDPLAAEKIMPNDWSRSTRALEVFFQTGQSITKWQQNMLPVPEFAERIEILALCPPRDILYQRINDRVDRMFAAGLVAEVQSLLDVGVSPDAKAFGAHGYRRVVEYLKNERTLESCIEQTKIDTRHYAKRQLTWWRNTGRVKWLYGFGEDEMVIQEALSLI